MDYKNNNHKDDLKDNEKKTDGISYTALGIALGVASGAAFKNIGLGIALGLAIGAGMDSIKSKKNDKQKKNND